MDPNTNPTPQPEQIQPLRTEQLPAIPAAPEVAPLLNPAPAAAGSALPVASVGGPGPAAAPASAPPVQIPAGGNPVMADDVDVIEKEWVDQAERVIKATENDPHVEEEAVEDLQIDYMKKRYGKDVKKSD